VSTLLAALVTCSNHSLRKTIAQTTEVVCDGRLLFAASFALMLRRNFFSRNGLNGDLSESTLSNTARNASLLNFSPIGATKPLFGRLTISAGTCRANAAFSNHFGSWSAPSQFPD